MENKREKEREIDTEGVFLERMGVLHKGCLIKLFILLNILINVCVHLSQDLKLDLSSQRTMNLFGETNELEANCNFYLSFAIVYYTDLTCLLCRK